MNNQCSPDYNPSMPDSDKEIALEAQLASLAKAISHPARIRILKVLLTLDKNNGCLNSDLVSELGLAQSTVSEHLRILKAADLITAEPIPPRMCYRINKETLTKINSVFNHIFM
ncbi:winged helix-turn-helix domain-containing protein [Vibrio sp. S4M6]|uniref:ArsR/SmtB family transcription factor n=1 Tax=Vibrio sinus TaxID=2946865 RepID=UPI00202AC145|nr:winged helix-turn-helix domain-containing protein [Vibrio sinus]MCL9783202.1 winged helix-turn-helix domain-containing protein [Vibrio sinus]